MIDEIELQCPFCWETIELTVDVSAGSQEYTEDCSVCCQAMLVRLRVDTEGRYAIDVERENE